MKKLIMLFVLMFTALAISSVVRADFGLGIGAIVGVAVSQFAQSEYNTTLPACTNQPNVLVKAENGNYYFERTACDVNK